jgi:replicative DNA helicase
VPLNLFGLHGIVSGQAARITATNLARAQLHDRNIVALGHIPLSHLLTPTLMTQADWDALAVAAGKIEQLNLYLDDQGGLNLLDVRLKAVGMQAWPRFVGDRLPAADGVGWRQPERTLKRSRVG